MRVFARAHRLIYLTNSMSNRERGARLHHFRASVQGAVRGSVLTFAALSTSPALRMHLSSRLIESGGVRWRGYGERDGHCASAHRYPCDTKQVEVKMARTLWSPPSWSPQSSVLASKCCSHSAPFFCSHQHVRALQRRSSCSTFDWFASRRLHVCGQTILDSYYQR